MVIQNRTRLLLLIVVLAATTCGESRGDENDYYRLITVSASKAPTDSRSCLLYTSDAADDTQFV